MARPTESTPPSHQSRSDSGHRTGGNQVSKTKTEAIERRRESGAAPTRSLRPGSLPADLIEFEELGLGDLPAPIMRAVADYDGAH